MDLSSWSRDEALSDEDVRFIERIMARGKPGSRLAFIHVTPSVHVSYVATRGDNGNKVELTREKYMVVGDMG
jgi:hypothetical protein